MPLTRRCASAVLAACAASTVFAAHDEAIRLRQGSGGLAPAALVKHVVVIFQENVSFDHYFATYPRAANLPGERAFTPLPGTPAVAGLSAELLTKNPNFTNPANGADAANPYRLASSQAATADQDHSYTQEQLAYDHGKMDFFPGSLGQGDTPPGGRAHQAPRSLNLAYFDGNTVTALWNYAQRFAMSDRFFQTTFGPSVLGALNLVSGQTNGVAAVKNGASPNVLIDGGAGSYTVLGDVDPIGDICSSSKRIQATMAGRNIGDLLDAANVTWGWFEAGFDVTAVNENGTTGCARSHTSAITGLASNDYIAHHAPFQYYPSTANLRHVRPSSVAAIGTKGDAANHQYDLTDFFSALDAGHFPAVAFLKPAAYQNGHAGYSDPIDEQAFLVRVLNDLQRRPEWASTVVFVTWDDSDGWYDHLMGPIVNSSVGPIDVLNGDGICGDGTAILPGVAPATHHALGRCGYGPRLPLIAISPWARRNYVDSHVTDVTSILRFIEDVFLDGRRIGGGSFDAIAGTLMPLFDFTKALDLAPLILDERTGAEVQPIGAGQTESIRIGPVDLFGTAGIDVAAVRARLPLHAGDTISHTGTNELRAKIQTAVTGVTGRAATDIAAVCCTAKGELMVYLGLPGANNRTIQHLPAPTGATCLPQTAVDLYDRVVDANEKAVEKGDAAEDDSLGYALAHNPELRQAQLEMRAFAIKNVTQIVTTLRGCARDEHRRAASMLLGYANRSTEQIAELVRAANDADSTVRNNAVRALGVLAAPSAEAAAGTEADGLVELLNSGDWTDRNKAGLLFMRLTETRRPALLAALTRQAFDSLVEMARWQDAPHATAYRLILGRIAGIEESRLVELANGTGVEEIIAAATKKRTERIR